jgi:hypothetical protein
MNKGWLGIINLYNPPNSLLSPVLFETICKKYEKYVLAGDLNYKSRQIGCRKDNLNADNLVRILEDNSLHVINDNSYTYRNFSSGEYDLLDLFTCTSNLVDKIGNFRVHDDDMLSDHFPVEIVITDSASIQIESESKNFNFKKADWDLFKSTLEGQEVEDAEINIMWNKSVKNIINSAKVAIPIKKQTVFKKTLSKNIVQIINDRKVARKKAKSGSPLDKANYNRLTGLLRLKTKENRNSEWSEFLVKMGKNPLSTRPFWQKINKFRDKKKGGTRLPLLTHEGKSYVSDSEKCDLFSSILADTFKLNTELSDEASTTIIDRCVNDKEYVNNYTNKSLFGDISKSELIYAISKTKKESTSGMDQTYNSMFRNLPEKNDTTNFKSIQ